LRLAGWEDEVINAANPGNRTTTSKKFYDNGIMSEKFITYYDANKVKVKTVKTVYDEKGKVTGTSTQHY
jgi:hypothetical protein